MLDPATVAEFIRRTTRSVILPRFRMLKREDIREKAPGNLVTIADTEAERELTRLLTAASPGTSVLGEEAAFADADLLARTDYQAPLWIIDPIDGTHNFAHGDPNFAVMVAYMEKGKSRAGWIYDPVGDRLVHAVAGGGAWSGERRLRLSSSPGRLFGSAYGRAASGQRAEKVLARGGDIGVRNRGCCGVEYLDIALGEADFSLHSRSLPWDHAAGMLITAELGGKAGFLDGSPYDPRIHDRAVLAAGSAEGWRRVHDIVVAPAKGAA